jgi:hypothetical protein
MSFEKFQLSHGHSYFINSWSNANRAQLSRFNVQEITLSALLGRNELKIFVHDDLKVSHVPFSDFFNLLNICDS